MNPYRDIALRWTPRDIDPEPLVSSWTRTQQNVDLFECWFTKMSKDAVQSRSVKEIHKEFILTGALCDIEMTRYYLERLYANAKIRCGVNARGEHRFWVELK